jgi:hypothetical protein
LPQETGGSLEIERSIPSMQVVDWRTPRRRVRRVAPQGGFRLLLIESSGGGLASLTGLFGALLRAVLRGKA